MLFKSLIFWPALKFWTEIVSCYFFISSFSLFNAYASFFKLLYLPLRASFYLFFSARVVSRSLTFASWALSSEASLSVFYVSLERSLLSSLFFFLRVLRSSSISLYCSISRSCSFLWSIYFLSNILFNSSSPSTPFILSSRSASLFCRLLIRLFASVSKDYLSDNSSLHFYRLWLCWSIFLFSLFFYSV